MDAKKFKELQMLMAEGDSEQVPEGYYNRQQIAVLIQRSQVTADKFIVKCLQKGSMKKLYIRRPTLSGVRPLPYFSLLIAIERQSNTGLGIQGQLSKVKCIQTKRKKTPRRKQLR